MCSNKFSITRENEETPYRSVGGFLGYTLPVALKSENHSLCKGIDAILAGIRY